MNKGKFPNANITCSLLENTEGRNEDTYAEKHKQRYKTGVRNWTTRPEQGRKKFINNSDRNKKTKESNHQLAEVEAKTAHTDYEYESYRSDPASQIKGVSKNRKSNWLLAGDGAGKYRPFN